MVERTMLHAREIGFIHPVTQVQMQFTANYPEDFRAAYTIYGSPQRWIY